MKKVLLIASIIGLFMAASLDLQARHSRNDQSRHVRSVISSSQSRHAPTRNRSNSYSQYGNRQERNVRGGFSFGPSRHAPMRNRYNSYSRYDNHPRRYVRGGISLGLSLFAPLLDRYNSYGGYYNHPGRYVASEIRSNEERIWLLEERLARLGRYEGNYDEILELEQEINYLQRRNDDLRNRRY
jgi:hypothetical protein